MKKKVKKKESKYVTITVFQKHQDFMARQFKKVFERFEQVDKRFEQVDKRFEQVDKRFEQVNKAMEIMLKEMQEYGKEAREHRMMMGALNYTEISQQRKIEGLELRIEKLEEKVK